ncbi:MAG: hypothetical protein ACLP5E_24520 [Streptosporangiaceae bacterium]
MARAHLVVDLFHVVQLAVKMPGDVRRRAACATRSRMWSACPDSSTTSCAFALDVESDYWATSAMQFTSYSPVTGQSYYMSATDNGTTVTATGGNGALVEFSDTN